MGKLKTYLEANKIRQEDFAPEIGITQSALSKICNGVNTPRLGTALAIERATRGAVPTSVWGPIIEDVQQSRVG